MTTYGVMRARIADELIRSDLTSQIGDAIQTAIRFYEAVNLPWNDGRSEASTTAGVNAVAAPADFIRADTLSLTVAGIRYDLDKKDWRSVDRLIGVTTGQGRPSVWAWYARQFWLYPTPDAAYPLTLSYRQRLPPLVGPDDTNAWMVEGEALIRARAKAELYLHIIQDVTMAGIMNQAATLVLDQLKAATEDQDWLGVAAPTRF